MSLEEPTMIRTAILFLALAAPLAAQDAPHNATNGIDCFSCHVMHNAPGAHYTNTQGAINLCMSCHNPLGVLPVSTHSPGGNDIACTQCHNPHTQEQTATYGSTFSFLIRTVIDTPNSGKLPVKLMGPTGPNSFADGDTTYDGVCEVCHTATAHHRNNPSGDHLHNAGADCTQCHPHEDGFQPTGGDCLACHNQPQPPGQGYRRQVVENNGDGNGDFVKPVHHVDDGSGNEAVTAGDCTTCHDQSNHQSNPDPEVLLNDVDGGPSIRFDGSHDSLTPFCLACHDADHAGGNAQPFTTPGTPPDIEQHWSNPSRHSVEALGAKCWTCHQNAHGSDNPHFAVALEESLCLGCHSGVVGSVNIGNELAKTYNHPVQLYSGTHTTGEDPLTMPRHVECEDCHNPHAANTLLTAPAPATPGGLLGVNGVDTNGAVVAEAANGYEVCYKCHAATNLGNPALPRVEVRTDVSVEFDPATSGGYHPIEAAGANSSVPSLINGWTTSSVMRCEDCHAGDSGVKGPHGSNNPWILKKTYVTADNTAESAANYALCYECHSRASILGNNSFKKHSLHISGEKAPCSVCHDGHASSGNHLINFRTDVVSPNSQGKLEFIDDGNGMHGTCNLRCHGKDHRGKSY
ncbi:MAG: hypothetical protein D6702_00870 [Planctomycetota bacterium]|nr:MAG: hypothetical protein D6702_00870 [Planctomycetota bacterium]